MLFEGKDRKELERAMKKRRAFASGTVAHSKMASAALWFGAALRSENLGFSGLRIGRVAAQAHMERI